ncbi:Ribosomal protein L1 [Artemisia annua]|uniref:Ribosomal protein L1 n=1 Tax=Artemisia annua TaxID=35608 RepID=A0A2U1P5W9_ARTAN|nr:Ribosomal protein L1 [Artemisia annua]
MAAMMITTDTITSAVEALQKWRNKTQSNQQLFLQDDDEFIYLILTLSQIPQNPSTNKLPLPHPLFSKQTQVCLIIDDRNITSKHAKDKILSDGILVTKVIKLSNLKTCYKPFEAKRKLCDSYDIFFADKRVIPFLPKLLGTTFFNKKKLPLPVDLTRKNWKQQIEKGFSSGLLFFGSGTCSVIRVAKSLPVINLRIEGVGEKGRDYDVEVEDENDVLELDEEKVITEKKRKGNVVHGNKKSKKKRLLSN